MSARIRSSFVYFAFQVAFLAVLSKAGQVEQKFAESEITPNIIDVSPTNDLQVVYKSDKSVNYGEEMNLLTVKNQPTIVCFDGANENSLYTLIMIDPDAPTRMNPILAPFLHWLVVNAPGADIGKGDTIADYRSPGALEVPSPHRYIFLLYEQSDAVSVKVGTRTKFDVKNFAQNYSLGNPIAGNFFLGAIATM